MGWIIQNNKLTNTDFVNLPSAPFHDYPLMFWRINQDINNGMPYIPLMIGVPVLSPEPPVTTLNIYFGSIKIVDIYYGTQAVSSVYFGNHKI